MRISKVLAAASAAALVASMGMTFVSADTTYTATKFVINTTKDGEKVSNISMSAWGSQWIKCYDEALKDADMSKLAIHFVVESDGAYTEKDNVAFKVYGVNGDNDQGEVFYGVAGTKTYDFYYNLKDVKIDQYGGFGFNTQAGHRDIKLVSADMVAVGESAPSSSTADSSSKADEATSSAAAGDSSKADDTSKPADDSKPADTKKDVDPMTLKTDLKTADGKVENTAVVLLTELNKDGSVKATSVLDGTGLTNLDVYGATFNITLGDTLAAKLEAGDWVGGGIGWNSESTKWNAAEYCWQDGVKEITAVKQADGSYNVTRTSDKAVFTGTDTYSQAWLQIYNEDDYTINSVTLLGKDGKAIAVVKNNALPDSVKPSDDKKDDNKGSSSVADGSSTTSTTSTNSTGTTSSKAANNASNTNPSTGAAALAAVGVALAGAAVVATKKRK